MALNRDRNTPERSGDLLTLPVAANTVIYAGALVAVNTAGYAAPGATAADLKAAGRAERQVVNNPGAAGDQLVSVKRGVFRFRNSDADPVAQANVSGDCYIVDDQTVAATSGTNTRSKAGKVLEIEAGGVWVEIR